ncbi:MAG: type I glutamate--ammonia ligase, partial [Clostridia bacterium]|nr:type I glutamate--ammonia ligase [Clostridia bacterium]
TENIYTMTDRERKAHGIASLPGNLLEAVELLEQDRLIIDALGEHVFKSFVSGKRAEWDEYRTRVTDWETQRYMIVY